MEIREATALDTGDIVEIGIHALEFAMPGNKPDYGHLCEMIHVMLKHGVVLVSVEGDKITGVIAGLVTPNTWFPDQLDLMELFWFVEEKYRGSSAALRLLREFTKRGKALDVKRIVMSSETHSPLSNNAYEKRGYKLIEKTFVMEV
jgi:RimJ/RimL family protein N-acetyltransferase